MNTSMTRSIQATDQTSRADSRYRGWLLIAVTVLFVDSLVLTLRQYLRAAGMLALTSASLMVTGCSLINGPLAPIDLNDENASKTPTKVIPVWTETVLHQQGKVNVRGCGARVTFYSAESEKPVRVDGAIIVYAWDDTDESKSRRNPDRKYVFTAEMLEKHYSPARAGHSYSLWIPWDEAGNPHRKLTLVTRFIGAAGGEVTSPAAKIIIPGPIAEPANEVYESDIVKRNRATESDSVVLADHQKSNGNELREMIYQASATVDFETNTETKTSSSSQLDLNDLELADTATIDLSPGFVKRHLANVPYLDLDSLDSDESSHRVQTTRENTNSAESLTPQHRTLPQRDAPAEKNPPSESTSEETSAAVEAGRAERFEDRFARSQFRARTTAAIRPSGDPIRRGPSRSKLLSGLQPTPRFAPIGRQRTTAQDAGEFSNSAARQLAH